MRSSAIWEECLSRCVGDFRCFSRGLYVRSVIDSQILVIFMIPVHYLDAISPLLLPTVACEVFFVHPFDFLVPPSPWHLMYFKLWWQELSYVIVRRSQVLMSYQCSSQKSWSPVYSCFFVTKRFCAGREKVCRRWRDRDFRELPSRQKAKEKVNYFFVYLFACPRRRDGFARKTSWASNTNVFSSLPFHSVLLRPVSVHKPVWDAFCPTQSLKVFMVISEDRC
jgi:hypothetical protein